MGGRGLLKWRYEEMACATWLLRSSTTSEALCRRTSSVTSLNLLFELT
jgi:hypothetical protein